MFPNRELKCKAAFSISMLFCLNFTKGSVAILLRKSRTCKILHYGLSNTYVVTSGTFKRRQLPTMEVPQIHVDQLTQSRNNKSTNNRFHFDMLFYTNILRSLSLLMSATGVIQI